MSTSDQHLDGLLGRLVAGKAESVTCTDIEVLATALAPSDSDDSSTPASPLPLLCLGKLVEAASSGGPAAVESLTASGLVKDLIVPLSKSPNLRVAEQLANLCALASGAADSRAAFVTLGGFDALTRVISTLRTPAPVPADTRVLLVGCEVYAKLVQTVPLPQLFSPSTPAVVIAGLGPLLLLAVHPAADPTQLVVALATLARLGLVHPKVGSAITSASAAIPAATAAATPREIRVVERVEGALLNPIPEVSRFAARLVAVLVNSRAGWYYFSGERAHFDFPGDDTPDSEVYKPAAASGLDAASGRRLGLLLLLLDADDSGARKAAATALALLSQSPCAAAALVALRIVSNASVTSPKLWARVADLFEPEGQRKPASAAGEARAPRAADTPPPDRELADRGAMLAANLLTFVDRLPEPERGTQLASAREEGLCEALQAGLAKFGDAVDANIKAALTVLNK
jgi:hypothetical protein